MKVGDIVVISGAPELGKVKIVRFYASHGTVLVEVESTKKLTYCDYENLEKMSKAS
tara:strand:+ start:407 stop:574 length:168 start_codon:yes stop_codon:yes gene_type:complete